MKKILFFLSILVVLLTACAPAQVSHANYDRLPYVDGQICESYWSGDINLSLAGFESETTLISEKREGYLVDQQWKVSLKSLKVDDRKINTKDWTVLKIIKTGPSDSPEYTSEPEPQVWIDKSKVLLVLAPDLVIDLHLTWNAKDDAWEPKYTCSIAK